MKGAQEFVERAQKRLVAHDARCVGRASDASDRFEVGGTGPPNAEFCGCGTSATRDPKWPAGSRRLDVFKTIQVKGRRARYGRERGCQGVRATGGRGVRVGEASNPGPVQTRQARGLERSNPIVPCRGFGSTQVDSSLDEEVLVSPNSGRDVVPSGELVAYTPPGSSEFRTSGTVRSRREVLTLGVDSETAASIASCSDGS